MSIHQLYHVTLPVTEHLSIIRPVCLPKAASSLADPSFRDGRGMERFSRHEPHLEVLDLRNCFCLTHTVRVCFYVGHRVEESSRGGVGAS